MEGSVEGGMEGGVEGGMEGGVEGGMEGILELEWGVSFTMIKYCTKAVILV